MKIIDLLFYRPIYIDEIELDRQTDRNRQRYCSRRIHSEKYLDKIISTKGYAKIIMLYRFFYGVIS